MRRKLTVEIVKVIALDYTSKQAFRKGDSGAHGYAQRHGFMDEACSHMIPVFKWTRELILEEAKNHMTRRSFIHNSNGAYDKAVRLGMYDEIKAMIDSIQVDWDYDKCKTIALNYTTRNAFNLAEPAAYDFARRADIRDEVCSHMEDNATSDGDMVYLWNIPNTNIYKIGVSSMRLGDQRVKEVARAMGVDYVIVGLYNIPNAFSVENALHKKYQVVPTTLPKKDGHTEFRILTADDVTEIVTVLSA